MRSFVSCLVLSVLTALPSPLSAEGGSACALEEPGAPRVLVLALDGTPLRVVQEAQRRGAFEGWPRVTGLVSTFPSMTNVAFTAILAPLGFPAKIEGYEIRRYDFEENRLYGGKRKRTLYPWKSAFDVYSDTLTSKADLYLSPIKSSDKLLQQIEDLLLSSPEPAIAFAHLPATDMTAHLDGDPATLEVVLRVDEMLSRLIPEHRARHGRELQVVLLSYHGNGRRTVWNTQGLRDTLRAAGFRFSKQLNDPRDLVVPVYGAVNYGALYLDPRRVREAAEAAVSHESVDLASWISGPGALRVLDRLGRVGLVRWKGDGSARRYGYEALRGDPLGLGPAARRLSERGALDDDGLGSRRAWFEASLDSEYPDAPARLVDALAGRWVENPATVLLSLSPRYAWGLLPTRIGASLLGGHQKGTHGGLDRDSSLGFFLVNDASLQPAGALPADQALTSWASLAGCVQVPWGQGADELAARSSASASRW